MKKVLASFIMLSILWISIVPACAMVYSIKAAANVSGNTQEFNLSQFQTSSGFDFPFYPATDVWKTLVGNMVPNTFNKDKVHYQLKKSENIIMVDSQLIREIRSPGMALSGSAASARPTDQIIENGGLIKREVLEAAAHTDDVKPGTIFVDETQGTAFKVVTGLAASDTTGAMAGHYSVVQPQISELVDYFELEEDTIELNRANITSFADPKIEKMVWKSGYVNTLQTSEEFLKFHYLDNPLIEMVFPSGTTLTGYLGNGKSVSVTLSGGLGLGDLDPMLNGTTALAMTTGDPILPARLITEFSRKNKALTVKAGFVEGSVVSPAQVDSLAGMVSKPALLSTVLGTLNAPIAALARLLNAIAEQNGGAPAEVPAE